MDKKNNLISNNSAKLTNNELKVAKGQIKKEATNFLDKIKKIINNNVIIIILVLLIIVIIIATYFYSDYFRPKNKLNELTNNLTYNKDRVRIDYCGNDNYIKDKIRKKIDLDKMDNSITFIDNINLYDLGITSEYYINIEGTDSNDNTKSKYYKVYKVEQTKIYFENSDNSERIKKTEKDASVTITYFRPAYNDNIYKYKLLADYYICSSFNSFLVGKHKLDYCDINMINKALHFGARYIELEIFNKEIKNSTEPIVCTGIENGNIITSLNYLMFDDCIKLIASHAFSERAIVNYNDPLFLFLNLKTGDNINTNDKIYNIITENLVQYLLSNKYNHTNISKLTLCELRRKIVILTNKTCPGSKLDNIITCSSDKPYLKRIKMSDLDLYQKSNIPKLEIISRNVKFNSDLDSYITIYDENIDLIKSGVKSGDLIQINNASNPVNNSGLTLNKIKLVKKNIIIFETQGLFEDESQGSQVVIKIYDESYISLNKGIEEYNKNNITIVVPDTKFYSKNYDYKKAHYKGCQFVAMNFQNQDSQMEKYFRQFQERSFKFKPEVLINEIELPKSISLNSMVPKKKVSPKYVVDYNFLSNIGGKGSLLPFINNKLKLISNNRNVKFSMEHNATKIKIVKGLDGMNDTFSFNLDDGEDRYLHTNDNCCYLYFSKKPVGNISPLIKNKFYKNASFIPLKPNIFNKGFNSFGIRKTHIIDGESINFLYQLRLRNYFSHDKKIYTESTTKYDVKFEFKIDDSDGEYKKNILTISDSDMVVLKPEIEPGSEFKPLGDVIIPRSELEFLNNTVDGVIKRRQNISTILYSGAVDKPKDYELIYDNKYFTTKNRPLKNSGIHLSVWKPIPNTGFSAVGVVFNKGYTKPSLDEVVCVSNVFLKEIDLEDKPLWYHNKSNLIFWKNKNNYYGNVYNSIIMDAQNTAEPIVKPNPIDNITFDIITEEKDYSSRIYLDKNILNEEEDKYSSIFSFVVDKKPKGSDSGVYDYLMDIENTKDKIMSYNTLSNSKMCLSLPQPYWTNIFDLKGLTPDKTEQVALTDTEDLTLPVDPTKYKTTYDIGIEQCKGEKYIGTNWNILEDKTIRLKDNSDYCLTYNGPSYNNEPYYGTNNEDSKIQLTKCKEDLKNQKFVINNNKIKLYNPSNSNSKYCLHHTKSNKLKVEQCESNKISLLWKWGKDIKRVDKCSITELENYMEEHINHIKDCETKNYYVIYRDKIDDTNKSFKYEATCSKSEALNIYNEIKDDHILVALYYDGEILEKKVKDNTTHLDNKLKIFCESLSSYSKYCNKCIYPDRIMCSGNKYMGHKYNKTSNKKILDELVDKCYNLTPSLEKCALDKRQKFIATKNDPSFCLKENREVFIYIFDEEQFTEYNSKLNIDLKRGKRKDTSSDLPDRIDNLLAEPIDYENYHLFIKGVIKNAKNNKFFKIIFDNDNTNLDSLYIPKTSYDIFLNKPAKYEELEVGTKVLCEHKKESEGNIAFKWDNSNDDTNITNITNEYVRWLAVVVEKLENENVKIIFSINSYESDKLKEDEASKKARPYGETNISKIVKAQDLVILRKAPMC